MNAASALEFSFSGSPRLSGPCRVAIVGFGTVGRSVARLIARAPSCGVELIAICNRRIDEKRVAWLPGAIRWTDSIEHTVCAADVDVVIELMGGIEPALTCIRGAIARGKSVVTANKQVIARYGPDLFALAAHNGVDLRCEAAAGGAVPIVRALAESLRGDSVTALTAVLNGTSNFVLERVAGGVAVDEAVRQAQALGITEADPSTDLDGDDAAAKVALLSMFAFGTSLDPAAMPRASVRTIARADFALARRIGLALKAIAHVRRRDPEIDAWVGPALVAAASPLAGATGARNAVVVEAQHSGETILAGEGAGGDPTAVAVLSDVLSIAGGGAWRPPAVRRASVCREPRVPHFVRLTVANRDGVPAAIACLHRADLRVASVITLDAEKGLTQVALGVECCRASDIRAALEPIAAVCSGTGAVLPVFSQTTTWRS
jgi:homoserine dehydrogenase